MESLRSIMGSVIPAGTKMKAQDHVNRQLDQWESEESEKRRREMFPNLEVAAMDLIWNADVWGLAERQRRKCGECQPGMWTYSPTTIPLLPSARSCPEPLRLAVTRDSVEIPKGCGTGRLRVRWIPCQTYRDWVESQTSGRESGDNKPRRGFWKKRA